MRLLGLAIGALVGILDRLCWRWETWRLNRQAPANPEFPPLLDPTELALAWAWLPDRLRSYARSPDVGQDFERQTLELAGMRESWKGRRAQRIEYALRLAVLHWGYRKSLKWGGFTNAELDKLRGDLIYTAGSLRPPADLPARAALLRAEVALTEVMRRRRRASLALS